MRSRSRRPLGLCAALGLSSGCSLMGARVPREPPPPAHCPEGVIIADLIGAAVTLVPAAAGVSALVENDSQAAVLAVYVTPPMAILAATYIASTIYGVRAQRRCHRMQEETPEGSPADHPREREPVRDNVVGDKPLHCAITEQDVGACFLDHAECAAAAETAVVSCEIRTRGWCFDATQLGLGDQQTTCAASLVDCETRRRVFTNDRTLLVTTCGTYEAKGPEKSD